MSCLRAFGMQAQAKDEISHPDVPIMIIPATANRRSVVTEIGPALEDYMLRPAGAVFLILNN